MQKVSPETLKVGDVVKQYIHFDTDHANETYPGTVIWIHPKKWFYRLRFKQPSGDYCTESYTFFGKQSGSGYVGWEKWKKQPIIEGEVKCNGE